MRNFCANYAKQLAYVLEQADWAPVETLGLALQRCWGERRRLFIAGNGGSDANALHLANDLLYGVGRTKLPGLRVHALGGNTSVTTCLANDLGYTRIFSAQIDTLAEAGDLLLVLSGSGNSANILAALKSARGLGMESFAILGYDGGQAKALVDTAIHFKIDDMQIAEDCQQIVGHMLMRWLCENPPENMQQ